MACLRSMPSAFSSVGKPLANAFSSENRSRRTSPLFSSVWQAKQCLAKNGCTVCRYSRHGTVGPVLGAGPSPRAATLPTRTGQRTATAPATLLQQQCDSMVVLDAAGRVAGMGTERRARAANPRQRGEGIGLVGYCKAFTGR